MILCVSAQISKRIHLGSINTGFTSGIPMTDYSSIYNLFAFDLSGGFEAFDTQLVPSTRVGYYRLEVEFNKGTTRNLQMVIFADFPSSKN